MGKYNPFNKKQEIKRDQFNTRYGVLIAKARELEQLLDEPPMPVNEIDGDYLDWLNDQFSDYQSYLMAQTDIE